jgi:H+/Cl- antiporter ClcA
MNHKPVNVLKYLYICLLALVLGFSAGAIVWAVLQLMDAGIDFVWTYLPKKIGAEDSLIYSLAVCLLGGLLIGLFQRRNGILPDNMEEVIGTLKVKGSYPYDRLHIIAVTALLPLIFGGSVGPGAGLSGMIAGLCCWAGDKLKYKGDMLVAVAEAGFAATLGVIFGSPFFGIVSNLEPDGPEEHYREKILSKKYRIVIYCFGVAGGMLGMKLMGKLTGLESSGLPRFGFKHAVGIDQWKWIVPLILIGIVFAFAYMIFEGASRKVGALLAERRITSCLIAAVLVAVCGRILPLSMFSGEAQLHVMIDGWQDYTVAVLLASAGLKLFLTSFCINLGWKGGNIFPIIFCGAMAGFAFALVTGMDGSFAAACTIASLYAFMVRKPVMVIAILLLCFPVSYIVPVAVCALIASKVPNPLLPKKAETKNAV